MDQILVIIIAQIRLKCRRSWLGVKRGIEAVVFRFHPFVWRGGGLDSDSDSTQKEAGGNLVESATTRAD
jgi:hypothetical protein